MSSICCFAGHSRLYNTDELYEHLLAATENLITNENISEFWVGNYGTFDSLSARAVRELKTKFPHIRLNLTIPYLTAVINNYKEEYYKNYDNILIADIPEKTPRNVKIIKCNQYMINKSDFLICYVKYSMGGAYKTLEYAKKKNIKIINLADN